MKKGGVLDLEMSARAVLTDWVQGKIPYCTKPPQVADDDQQKSPVAEKEPCISKRAL
jgi:ribosome biogenesis GTPase A